MCKYNLTEYSGTYSKTLGSLWQYYRDEPALGNNNAIDFLLITIIVVSFTSKQ